MPDRRTAGSKVVSQTGGVLLTETVRTVGLDRALSAALARWRRPSAVHDPGKVVPDLAVTLALGGDCLADIALLRAEPGVYGPVASDPTLSRTTDRLAADPVAALRAINTARAAARARARALAGVHAPDHAVDAGAPLVIDVDATLVTAHSDKQGRRRRSNAGSDITVLREALRQLPGHRPGTRPGRKILIRADAAGCTHELLDWITAQRLSYSVGFTLPDHVVDELANVPERDWQPAYDADGEPRPAHGCSRPPACST